MKYEDVPLKSIKVKDRSRVDMGDLQSLADSFLQLDSSGHPVGILEPIVVDQNYNLLAGGRRHAAAELAGMQVVPCVVRNTHNKVDALEIELLENVQRKDMAWPERAALEKKIFDWKSEHDPKWNQRKQAEFLEESKGAVSRRIQLAEALTLLPDLAEAPTEEEAWKTYKKLEEDYVVKELSKKTGADLSETSRWAADHYQIGDALAKMLSVAPGIADFAEVDPPYGVDLQRVKGRNKGKGPISTYNEIDTDEFEEFFTRVATQTFRILKENTFGVFWFGPTWHEQTRDILRKVGFGVSDIPAIWIKGGSGQTASPDSSFGSCYEPFWLARKGTPKLAKPGRPNVFDYKALSPTKKIHATEKPIGLLEDIISTCCFPGSVIISPFLGSGVTLRAAYKLKHTGWGYDLDQVHKEAFLKKVAQDAISGTAQNLGNSSEQEKEDEEDGGNT